MGNKIGITNENVVVLLGEKNLCMYSKVGCIQWKRKMIEFEMKSDKSLGVFPCEINI